MLSSPEKRMAYDVFQQTDFQQDERILDQLKWQFKNETMRAEQYRLYQLSQKTVGIVFEVVPFYLTWFILGIVFLKEDRRKAKIIIMVTCIAMGAFEGYTAMSYGDPDHMHRFELLKSIFPDSYTMKDNLQLLRAIFPLLFQFVILCLDYTFD